LREYVQVLCKCFDIRHFDDVFTALHAAECVFDPLIALKLPRYFSRLPYNAFLYEV
jgi:hypothetical protein